TAEDSQFNAYGKTVSTKGNCYSKSLSVTLFPSTLMRPLLWLILVGLSSQLRITNATKLRNVTIDDQDVRISYFPRAAWGKITDNMDAGGTHMVTGQEGSYAVLTFSFVSVYFLSTLWPYHVAVDISIDGQTSRLDLQDYTKPVVSWGNRATTSSQIVAHFPGTFQKERTITVSVPPGDKIAVVDMLMFEVDDSVSNPPGTIVTTSTVFTGTTITAGNSDPSHVPNGSGGSGNKNAPPITTTGGLSFSGDHISVTSAGTTSSSTRLNALGGFSNLASHGSAPTSSSGDQSSDAEKKGSRQTMAAIIGGAVGGLVAFALLMTTLWLILKRQRKPGVGANATYSAYHTMSRYDVNQPGADHRTSYTDSADPHHRVPLMSEVNPYTSSTAAHTDARDLPQHALYQDGGLGNPTYTLQDGASTPRPKSYQDPFSDYSQPYHEKPPHLSVSRPMSVATLAVDSSTYNPQSQPGADPVTFPGHPYDTSLLAQAPPFSYGDGRL
ncbi:hypothetical protein CVT24_013156, partial [Panaeolus cyanescens]